MQDRSALAAYDAFLRRNRLDMWLMPDIDPKLRRVMLRKGDGPIRELPISLRASGDPPQELMSAQMLRNIQYLVLGRRAGGVAVLESLEDAFLHDEFDHQLRSILGEDLYEEFLERVGFEPEREDDLLLAA